MTTDAELTSPLLQEKSPLAANWRKASPLVRGLLRRAPLGPGKDGWAGRAGGKGLHWKGEGSGDVAAARPGWVPAQKDMRVLEHVEEAPSEGPPPEVDWDALRGKRITKQRRLRRGERPDRALAGVSPGDGLGPDEPTPGAGNDGSSGGERTERAKEAAKRARAAVGKVLAKIRAAALPSEGPKRQLDYDTVLEKGEAPSTREPGDRAGRGGRQAEGKGADRPRTAKGARRPPRKGAPQVVARKNVRQQFSGVLDGRPSKRPTPETKAGPEPKGREQQPRRGGPSRGGAEPVPRGGSGPVSGGDGADKRGGDVVVEASVPGRSSTEGRNLRTGRNKGEGRSGRGAARGRGERGLDPRFAGPRSGSRGGDTDPELDEDLEDDEPMARRSADEIARDRELWDKVETRTALYDPRASEPAPSTRKSLSERLGLTRVKAALGLGGTQPTQRVDSSIAPSGPPLPPAGRARAMALGPSARPTASVAPASEPTPRDGSGTAPPTSKGSALARLKAALGGRLPSRPAPLSSSPFQSEGPVGRWVDANMPSDRGFRLPLPWKASSEGRVQERVLQRASGVLLEAQPQESSGPTPIPPPPTPGGIAQGARSRSNAVIGKAPLAGRPQAGVLGPPPIPSQQGGGRPTSPSPVPESSAERKGQGSPTGPLKSQGPVPPKGVRPRSSSAPNLRLPLSGEKTGQPKQGPDPQPKSRPGVGSPTLPSQRGPTYVDTGTLDDDTTKSTPVADASAKQQVGTGGPSRSEANSGPPTKAGDGANAREADAPQGAGQRVGLIDKSPATVRPGTGPGRASTSEDDADERDPGDDLDAASVGSDDDEWEPIRSRTPLYGANTAPDPSVISNGRNAGKGLLSRLRAFLRPVDGPSRSPQFHDAALALLGPGPLTAPGEGRVTERGMASTIVELPGTPDGEEGPGVIPPPPTPTSNRSRSDALVATDRRRPRSPLPIDGSPVVVEGGAVPDGPNVEAAVGVDGVVVPGVTVDGSTKTPPLTDGAPPPRRGRSGAVADLRLLRGGPLRGGPLLDAGLVPAEGGGEDSPLRRVARTLVEAMQQNERPGGGRRAPALPRDATAGALLLTQAAVVAAGVLPGGAQIPPPPKAPQRPPKLDPKDLPWNKGGADAQPDAPTATRRKAIEFALAEASKGGGWTPSFIPTEALGSAAKVRARAAGVAADKIAAALEFARAQAELGKGIVPDDGPSFDALLAVAKDPERAAQLLGDSVPTATTTARDAAVQFARAQAALGFGAIPLDAPALKALEGEIPTAERVAELIERAAKGALLGDGATTELPKAPPIGDIHGDRPISADTIKKAFSGLPDGHANVLAEWIGEVARQARAKDASDEGRAESKGASPKERARGGETEGTARRRRFRARGGQVEELDDSLGADPFEREVREVDQRPATRSRAPAAPESEDVLADLQEDAIYELLRAIVGGSAEGRRLFESLRAELDGVEALDRRRRLG